MSDGQTYEMRLAKGMQTVRIERDSVDYRWNGSDMKFHGTLPLENLRLHTRFSQRDRRPDLALGWIVLACLALVAITNGAPEAVQPYNHYLFMVIAVAATRLVHAQLKSAHEVIYIQIEPQPFGFKGELPVPNNREGRTFLSALEVAWSESLRRRFLDDHTGEASLRLLRIDWLLHVGVLTDLEAEFQRSLCKQDAEFQPLEAPSLN